MERQSYDLAALEHVLRQFEERHDLTTERFLERVQSGDVEGIPRFERHLWLSYHREAQSMRAGDDALSGHTQRVLEAAC